MLKHLAYCGNFQSLGLHLEYFSRGAKPMCQNLLLTRVKFFLLKISYIKGWSCKKFRNKVEIKAQRTNLIQTDGEERQEEYPTSFPLWNILRVLSLSSFTTIGLYKVSPSCFYFYLVSVLFTAPSLHVTDFQQEKFLP